MERYQDKKAVIIGGTSGMGLATAKMLPFGPIQPLPKRPDLPDRSWAT